MNKTKRIIVALAATLIATSSFAQQNIEKDLKFAGDIAIINEDGSYQKIQSLKVKLTITNTMIIDQPEAKSRTTAEKEVKLVVNIPEGQRPQNCLNIIKMNKTGNKLIHQFSLILGYKFLEFDVEPYGDKLTLIILRNYEPGEYLIRYYTDEGQLGLLKQDGMLLGLDAIDEQ